MSNLSRTITLTLLIGLLFASSLLAAPRSQAQARLIAEHFCQGRLSLPRTPMSSPQGHILLTLVSAPQRTAGDNLPLRTKQHPSPSLPDECAYFIYNIGEGAGFVIVSGDDLFPEVIGYSEEGAIAPEEEMPEHVASFFASLRATLNYYVEHQQPISTPHAKNLRPEGVPALLGDIAWNQGDPWWGECPRKGGERSYVGCVATAISQIMRYHEWPRRPMGSYSYTEKDGTRHSVDFSKYEYNWSLMPHMINEETQLTTAQRKELAKLCYHVGVACNMDYSPRGSGTFSAYPAHALRNYFRYNKDLALLERNHYKVDEWIEIVANELNHQRPLYYAGASISTGHAFVCDGYNAQGYFHINFGWAGAGNGYYLLHVMSPDVLGAGGGSSYDGFSADQEIIIGIEPDREGSTRRINPEVVSAYNLFVSSTGTLISCREAHLGINADLSFSTVFSLAVRPLEGGDWHYGSNSRRTNLYLHQIIGIENIPSLDIAALGLPTRNADYLVSIAYEANGEKYLIAHTQGYTSQVIVHFDDNGFSTVEKWDGKPSYEITGLEHINLKGYNDSSIDLKINNPSEEEFLHTAKIYFEDEKGDQRLISTPKLLIPAATESTHTISITPLLVPAGSNGHLLYSSSYPSFEEGRYTSRGFQLVSPLVTVQRALHTEPVISIEIDLPRDYTSKYIIPKNLKNISLRLTNRGDIEHGLYGIVWSIYRYDGRQTSRIDQGSEGFPGLAPNNTKTYTIPSPAWDKNYLYALEVYTCEIYNNGNGYSIKKYQDQWFEWIAIADEEPDPINESKFVAFEYNRLGGAFSLEATKTDMNSGIRVAGGSSHPPINTTIDQSTLSVNGLCSGLRVGVVGDTQRISFEPTGTRDTLHSANFTYASEALDYIYLPHGNLRNEYMTQTLSTLPNRAGKEAGQLIIHDMGAPERSNVCNKEQIALATARNWNVLQLNEQGALVPYAGINEETQTYSVTLESNEYGTLSVAESDINLARVLAGTQLTLVAEPMSDQYYLEKLIINGQPSKGTKSVIINSDTHIKAIFAQNTGTESLTTAAQPHLFPNPTSDLLHIEGVERGTEIKIYSLTGQIVASAQAHQEGGVTINLSHLPAGCYIVQIGGAQPMRIMVH